MQNRYNHSTVNLRESVFSEDRSNPIHKRFLEYVGKTKPLGRILDIGTGNGYILREIQKRYPGKYQLIGIDNSPEMLVKAIKKEKHFDKMYVKDYRRKNE